MSFGFSAGDFLAATKLIASITKCLGDANGSASEFQEPLRELGCLDQALKHVDKLEGTTAAPVKCAALMCRHPLASFLSNIQNYQKSLELGQSDGMSRNSARKICWAFTKKDEIRKLRDYLSMHVGAINIELMNYGLAKLDFISEQRVADMVDLHRVLEEMRNAVLRLGPKSDAPELVLRENQSSLQWLIDTIINDVSVPLKGLGEMVTRVFVSTEQIYTVMLEMRSFLPPLTSRFLNFQDPIVVEDSLGKYFPFPSELDLGSLQAVIQHRFGSGLCSYAVKLGDYELFNSKNTKQVLADIDSFPLVPAMNITMAVIIMENVQYTDNQCPMTQCGSSNTVSIQGGRRICSECRIKFDVSTKKKEVF